MIYKKQSSHLREDCTNSEIERGLSSDFQLIVETQQEMIHGTV